MYLTHYFLLFTLLISCFNCQVRSLKFENIVGGDVAEITDYPYTAYIHIDPITFCSGAFISVRHVISVIHCLLEPTANTIILNHVTITGGVNNIHNPSTGPFIATAKKAYIHNKFQNIENGIHSEGDIVIFLLNKDIPLNSPFVKYIALPEPYPNLETQLLKGKTLSFIAYGAGDIGILKKHNIRVDTYGELLAVTTYVKPIEDCERVFNVVFDSAKKICTKVLQKYTQPTHNSIGDSGGPLVSVAGGKHILVGLLSATPEVGSVGVATSIHTRVSFYRDFIDNVIAERPDINRLVLDYKNGKCHLTLSIDLVRG